MIHMTSDDSERYHPVCAHRAYNISITHAHRPDIPLHQRKKFVVFEECLMALFKKCRNCQAEGTNVKTRVLGTFLTVTQHCSNCLFTFSWDSQPMIRSIPAGNILLSAAILFSGVLPTKVMRMLRFYECVSISEATYFAHQSKFLQPSIFTVWNQNQALLFKELRKEKRPLIIGDGRADSPGHSAKFGSYTFMELKNKAVIDIQLVQVMQKNYKHLLL